MNKLAFPAQDANGLALASGQVMPPSATNGVNGMDGHNDLQLPLRKDLKPVPGRQSAKNGVGIAASDTPLPSAPPSPKL